ncbi:4'-phosphopantetheinyl transferase family protein [Trichothermofontia sp.]
MAIPQALGTPARLLPNEVQVFYVSIPHWQTELDRLWPLLDAQEQQRADRFIQDSDRQRFIISHGTLRQILGWYLAIAPRQLGFQVNAFGKPYVAGAPIAFNLSHSGQGAAIAVTAGTPVGIDIEASRPIANLPALGRHVFSPAEQAAFREIPATDQLSAFFQLWTRKEALLKAVGRGLHVSPTRLTLGFTAEPQAIDLPTALAGCGDCGFTRVSLYPLSPSRCLPQEHCDYWGALAVANLVGLVIEQCWLPDRTPAC